MAETIFDRCKVRNVYCAFVDVLGFGATTLRDHAAAMDLYERLLSQAAIAEASVDGVRLNVYSDAFVLVSEALAPVIGLVQILQWLVLMEDYLVRGGIAYGPHIAAEKEGIGLVVSSDSTADGAETSENLLSDGPPTPARAMLASSRRQCALLSNSQQAPMA